MYYVIITIIYQFTYILILYLELPPKNLSLIELLRVLVRERTSVKDLLKKNIIDINDDYLLHNTNFLKPYTF